MYYLVEAVTANGTTAKTIWEKDSIDSATMALHQTVASAMANNAASDCLCMVLDKRGSVLKHEYWEREGTEA